MPMRPSQVSQTGTGTVVIPLDHYAQGYAFQAEVTGSVTFQVDYTLDPDPRQDGVTNWVSEGVIATGSSAAQAQLAYPVTAVRLNVTAGAGTATLNIVTQDDTAW